MTAIAHTARSSASETIGAAACLRHGPLARGAGSCARCGGSAYRLDDEGDRATLKAYRAATLKSRMGYFAGIGAVVAVLVHNLMLQLAASGAFSFDVATIAFGALVGAGAGWAARTPGQHRLDRLLAK